MEKVENLRGGQIFTFSAIDGQTDWKNGLVARVMGKTLELRFPCEGGALLFDAEPDGIYGDCLTAGATRVAFADAFTLLIDGDFLPIGIPNGYKIQKRGSLAVLAVGDFFDEKWFNADFNALYAQRRQWVDDHTIGADAVLRRAVSQLKTQVCSPEGILTRFWTTPDRWPHRSMWLWDSVFHALALRHLDLTLAKDAIYAVFDGQLPDGFIPHRANPDGRSDETQPPILAYGVSKILEISDDTDFLAELYPKNKAFLNWCATNRDRDGAGLLEWFIRENEPNCRCGESGMDNSCRFDEPLCLDAPDFNAFYARECLIMEGFAHRLHLDADAEMWKAKRDRLNRLMNERLWDDESGLYVDCEARSGKKSKILSSAGFLPLLSGAPTQEMAAKMAALLQDSTKFGTQLPVPSVSRDCPGFGRDMWRGPVWTNYNLLIAEGLRNYGYDKLADEIIDKTQATVAKYFRQYGAFFEFFDADDAVPPCALDRKGPNNPYDKFSQPIRDFGWTATLYIDLHFRKLL